MTNSGMNSIIKGRGLEGKGLEGLKGMLNKGMESGKGDHYGSLGPSKGYYGHDSRHPGHPGHPGHPTHPDSHYPDPHYSAPTPGTYGYSGSYGGGKGALNPQKGSKDRGSFSKDFSKDRGYKGGVSRFAE